MKTRKITKAVGVVLVMSLLIAMMSLVSFAANMTGIEIVEPPRTVYYEGVDFIDGELYYDDDDLAGMVVKIIYDDGSSRLVTTESEDALLFLSVRQDLKLGENTLYVECMDDLYEENMGLAAETALNITIEENPVESIEILKMPTRTEFYMDTDVVTRENFSPERFYAFDAEQCEEFLMYIFGMEYADYLEYIKTYPEEKENFRVMFNEAFFGEDEAYILTDGAGCELKVTYKDGTTEIIESDDDFSTYGGVQFPVLIGQTEGKVVEGTNEMYFSVMGVRKTFNVTVKKTAPTEKPTVPEEKPTEPTTKPTEPATKPADPKPANPKNPVIPNTSGTSAAAAAVLALVSGCGIALVVSKKEK